MNSINPMKILWSVDAFDDMPSSLRIQAEVIQSLGRKTAVAVTPVYAMGPLELGLTLEMSGQWPTSYVPAAKKALEKRLQGLSVPGLGEPQVVVEGRPTLKGTVASLSKYVAEQGFDLVIVGTHGRKGANRMMLGSFAEELLLQSPAPVLIVGNHAGAWNDQDLRMLLPTDLADPSSPFFGEAFGLAKALGAQVTLLVSNTRPIEQVYQSGVFLLGGSWVPAPVYLETTQARMDEAAKKVLDRAQRDGVPCKHVIDDLTPSVTDAILNHAREHKVSLIAMQAQSGPLASALLGSITRQVVRSAPCPVLVHKIASKKR